MDLAKLDKWHKSGRGYLTYGVVELAIAYGFASWAIDTAHTWCYVLTILFLVGGFKNLLQAGRQLFHH